MTRMACWICGAAANTGEHKTKQSDLRAVLEKPSQSKPFYYHDKSTQNRPIGSYKRDFLKSQSRLRSVQQSADPTARPRLGADVRMA